MQKRQTVLVTNDDSIRSSFLKPLVRALQEAFDVVIAAPLKQQSFVGRSFSYRKQVEVHPQDEAFWGCKAWAIDGTTSDCVNIALGHLLPEKPVAIVSGINQGFNATLNIILGSGTVAAALEGAFWGVPSFAFSMEVPDSFDAAVATGSHHEPDAALAQSLGHSAQHACTIVQSSLQELHQHLAVHNINFPVNTTQETAIIKTEPGIVDMGTIFRPIRTGLYEFQYPEVRQIHHHDRSLTG
ncbi:MAG TPA: 5'/3'-nucleotidase SurE, partial [Opitutales bacterium]|nr:5'/3'-nucleotidase SurE [Opitutales bacterium]